MTRTLVTAFVGTVAAVLGPSLAQTPTPPGGPGSHERTEDARAERWRDDLALLSARLPEVHPDFFHSTTPEAFAEAVDLLDKRLGGYDDARVTLEFARLAAMGRDSHTGVDVRRVLERSPGLPVRFVALEDGVFVHAAAGRHAGLIGARVVAIAGVPIDEVLERVSEYFAWENEPKRLNTAPEFARVIPVLAAAGVVEEDARVTVSIEQRGTGAPEASDVTLAPLPGGAKIAWRSWLDGIDPKPLAARRSSGFYQSDFIPNADGASGAMYVAYNRCQESTDLPFADFARFVMSKAQDLNARRVIIDVRRNPGGNEAVIMPLITALDRSPRFDAPGSVVVLIGRRTFSSAMSNAITLRGLGAVLIGEATGGKPNHFGELRSFDLPRSGLRVYHSTRRWERVKGDPASLEPDVAAPVTSADFFAGRDAAIEAAMAYEPPEPEPETDLKPESP